MTCDSCIRHTPFSEYCRGENGHYARHARCQVFGHEIYPDHGRCQFHCTASDALKRAANYIEPAKYDLIKAAERKTLKFKIPPALNFVRRFEVITMCVRGSWYGGSRFDTNDRGMFGQPYIVGPSFNTELGAIDNEIDRIINYMRGHDHEREITEWLRGIKFNNRQLTLFSNE